jgi:hypothetical protein
MTVMVVVPLEQFGLEQCVDEVDEKASSHEARERIVKDHDSLSLQLLAGVDIRD